VCKHSCAAGAQNPAEVPVESSAMAAVPLLLVQGPIVHVELCAAEDILLRLGSSVLLLFLASHQSLGCNITTEVFADKCAIYVGYVFQLKAGYLTKETYPHILPC